jgi:hypothetical protein
MDPMGAGEAPTGGSAEVPVSWPGPDGPWMLGDGLSQGEGGCDEPIGPNFLGAAGPVRRRGCCYAIFEDTSPYFALGKAGGPPPFPPLISPLSPFYLVETRRVTLGHDIMLMLGRNTPEMRGEKTQDKRRPESSTRNRRSRRTK